MGKLKYSRDTRKIARTFAAILKEAFATINDTGIAAPSASRIIVKLPEGHRLCLGMEMKVTIAPGIVVPIDVNAIIRDDRMHGELRKAATQIADGLRWMWEDRGRIAAAIEEARPKVEQALAQARCQDLPVTLVEIGPERENVRSLHDRGPRRHECTVTIRAVVGCLNDMLVRADEEISGWNGDELANSIGDMLQMQRIRCDRKNMLADIGATGIIDTLALRVMDKAGANLAQALRDLTASGFTQIDGRNIRDDDVPVIISLALPSVDGVAQVEIRLSDQVLWDNDRLVIVGMALPETLKLALLNQPVTNLVQHPLLLDDMIITDMVEEGDLPRVNVRSPTRFYNAETSRIWQ